MLSIKPLFPFLSTTPRPEVTIDSPPDGTLYPLTQETTYALTATVHDNEHSLNQLTFEWQTILHHNIHEHPNAIDTSPTSSITVDPLGCDGQTYYYRVILKVTDPVGASTNPGNHVASRLRRYPEGYSTHHMVTTGDAPSWNGIECNGAECDGDAQREFVARDFGVYTTLGYGFSTG